MEHTPFDDEVKLVIRLLLLQDLISPIQIPTKWSPAQKDRVLEITGLVVVSDGEFHTFRSRLEHMDVYLACGLCLRADTLLHHRVGREIMREFLEFDPMEFTEHVEALRYTLESTDFQLRYKRNLGIQIECPLGYLSRLVSLMDLLGTVAGVVLWENTVQAFLRSGGVSSVEDEQPEETHWSPTKFRRQLSQISCFQEWHLRFQ